MPPAAGAIPPPPPASAAASEVLLGRYELGRLLGRGASAKVFLARDLLTGDSVAIKSFPNPRQDAAAAAGGVGGRPPAVLREAAILRRLRHRHVLRLREILATRKKVHFVLDLAAGGELFSLLDAEGRMTEDLSRRYFRQLISAVRYCHSRGVYHRDIKPENLLLDAAGDLRVADFGLGAFSDAAPASGLFHTQCGTPAYVAPEILAKRGYHPAKADVWSCGVVLFVLAAGYLPFNDASLVNMYRKIYRAEFRCPSWFSPELRHLVRLILDPNPDTRIDVDAIAGHPWFRAGLDDDEWADLMRSHDELAWFKAEFKDDSGRDMTAFDIISFSPGCDLSGLFGAGPARERFFLSEPGESVLNRVREAGRREGLRVLGEGKKGTGPVFIQGRSGDVVARVGVSRIADEVSVIEVVRGDGEEAARFWKDRLEPAVAGRSG